MTVHLSAEKIKRCAKYLVLRCINGFMLLFGTILHSLKLLPTASSKHTQTTRYLSYKLNVFPLIAEMI